MRTINQNAAALLKVLGGAVAILTLGLIHVCRENARLKYKLLEATKQDTPFDEDEDGDCQPQNERIAGQREFTMQEIGTVRSPFPQRAGCPRQGTLAPHVISHIVLNSTREMLDGFGEYSHVWVIFSFHLNPRGKARQGGKGSSSFAASKIRPPRAKGRKVGVLASRAPHRPNPIGLSLAMVDSIQTTKIKGKSHVFLALRGLDLVDNTPVYDIKPYVPWDCVDSFGLRVPHWVSADDELARVTWSQTAKVNLRKAQKYLSPLYPCTDQGFRQALMSIAEIVSQDPRALHDGRGKSTDAPFEFSFGELRVSFVVETGNAACIVDVIVDKGDLSSMKGSYPHLLAVRRQAEAEAAALGQKSLSWANPVREGDTEGLFMLQDGTKWQGSEKSYVALM